MLLSLAKYPVIFTATIIINKKILWHQKKCQGETEMHSVAIDNMSDN